MPPSRHTRPQNRANGRGAYSLAAAMLKAASRVADADDRLPTIGTISDPRPAHLAVRLAGYDAPVPCTASDLFDLFPLAFSDVVLALPISGGGWHVIDRLTGAEPEIAITRDDIDGAIVVPRAPFDDQNVGVQALRSAPTEYASDATVTHLWTFEEAFDDPPYVVVTPQGTNASDLVVAVRSVSEEDVLFEIKNHGTAAVTARLVALATGVV